METEYSNIRKQINIVYYSLYVVYLLLVVVFGFLLKGKEGFITIDPLSQYGQIISYVVIMYVIVSIPGALWWFKKQMKKVCEVQDEAAKRARYLSCSNNRQRRRVCNHRVLLFGQLPANAVVRRNRRAGTVLLQTQ